jgi:hypothetical protein
MTVDPRTLRVSFSTPIWFGYVRDIQGEYYESRINVAIEPHRRGIAHFERQGKAPAVLLDSLMVQADGSLISRDKRQVVARFRELSVLVDATYFYAEEYRNAAPTVLTEVAMDVGWQVARESASLPASPSPTVTGVAIVRVLSQRDGGVVTGSANYAVDGLFRALNTRSLHSGRVDDSTVSFTVNGERFPNGTSFVADPNKLDAFGFPARFNVPAYQDDPRLPASLATVASLVDFVLIQYDLGEWTLRHEYKEAKLVSTQVLHAKELPEDAALKSIDRRSQND